MQKRLINRAMLAAFALAVPTSYAVAQTDTVEHTQGTEQSSPASTDSSALVSAISSALNTHCGVPRNTLEWFGGEELSSDIIGQDTALDIVGWVPASETKHYGFTISERQQVRVEAAANVSGDPIIGVVDADGRELGSDDDGGNGSDSLLELSLAAGQYCLTVTDYGDEPLNMTARLGLLAHEKLSPEPPQVASCQSGEAPMLSETPITADMLSESVSASANMSEVGAMRFVLAEASPLTITARNGAGDPVARLRAANGSLIAENDDADGTDSRIDRPTALAAGEYCLDLEDLDGADNTINVTLSAFDVTALRQRQIDTGEITPLSSDNVDVLSLGVISTSTISDVMTSERASWGTLEVNEPGLLVIEAIGQGVDPKVVLFDHVGRRIAEDDDSGQDTDAMLVQRVNSGTYMIAVLSAGGDGEVGNTRLLIERYVPAK